MSYLRHGRVAVLFALVAAGTLAPPSAWGEEATQRRDLLRAKDGASQYGQLVSFDGKLFVWRDESGAEHRIPVQDVSGVVLVQPSEKTLGAASLIISPQGEPLPIRFPEGMWADRFVSFRAGVPAPAEAVDGKAALGKPDYDERIDDPRTYVSLGNGGELIVEFTDNRLVDVPGPDLIIVEIGPKAEPTLVSISEDGKAWIPVGKAEGAKAALDIGPHIGDKRRQFRFVKLIDAKAGASSNSRWPGADIDAIGALGTLPAPK